MSPSYLDRSRGRLAYETAGAGGLCLLFLHGTGCDNRDWDAEKRLLVPAHPRIAWRWLPDCGHYIPLEKPAATAAVCMERNPS